MKIMAMLRRNLGLKILALALAAVTCVIVRTLARPVGNLPTQRVYTKSLDVIAPDRSDLIANVSQKEVTVTLKGKRTVLERIDPSLISVVVDLSDRSKPANALELVEVMAPGGADVAEVQPSHVWVSVSKREYSLMPVKVELIGKAAENYLAGLPMIEPEKLRVMGAQENVDKVVSVQVPISISGAKEAFSTRSNSLNPVDVNGRSVKEVDVQGSSVYVTVPVGAIKEVPVKLDNISVEKLPGWDYKVTCQPDKVKVGSDSFAVADIKSLSLRPYSFPAQENEQTKRVKVIVPEGIAIAPGSSDTVAITVSPSLQPVKELPKPVVKPAVKASPEAKPAKGGGPVLPKKDARGG